MAAPSVVVSSPADPPTAECPIYLPANSALVTITPYLDWLPAPPGPGGSVRVQLSTFQAVRAFLPRCSISRLPADLTAARAINAFTFRLTDGAWTRLLSELHDAGVFAHAQLGVPHLHDCIGEATLPNPANLALVAAWRLAPCSGVGGGSRRRRSCCYSRADRS